MLLVHFHRANKSEKEANPLKGIAPHIKHEKNLVKTSGGILALASALDFVARFSLQTTKVQCVHCILSIQGWSEVKTVLHLIASTRECSSATSNCHAL